MKKFTTLKEAFLWAFDEKEDFHQIKSHFNLNDEFESIHDVVNMLSMYALEKYLLEESYIVKRGTKYIFYHDELSKVMLNIK